MKCYLFACIEKNIGDDLFVKIICDRYPNVDFVITSKAQYGSLKDIPNLHFSKELEQWQWATTLGENHIIKYIIAQIIQKVFKLRLPRYEIGITIVGNAFKNVNYSGWKQSRWIRERIRLVKHFYLISTNFGPYNDIRWKKDFDRIFSKMEDVCFRDKYSYDLFKTKSNIRYAPDAVISMGIQQNTVRDGKHIIISIIDCSFFARNDSLKKSASLYEKRMAEVVSLFLHEGYEITLLNSNTEQDRPACDRILGMVNSERVKVIDYRGDLKEIDELFRNATCVVATRLHTIVLAWLYRLPIVPIIYDIKVENLLTTCEFVADKYYIDRLESVSAAEIYNSLQKYCYILPSEIINRASEQFEEIDKVLMYERNADN